MFRNMVTSLFKHERIQTTDTKAKEVRRWADNLITLAKRGDLHARRQALAIMREKDVVHKLFEEVGEKFGSVSGGYTRVVKVGRRPGDAAPISLVELIVQETAKKKPRKKKTKTTAAKKKTDAKAATAPQAAAADETAGEKAAEAPAAEKKAPARKKKETVKKAETGKQAKAKAVAKKTAADPAEKAEAAPEKQADDTKETGDS